MPPTIAATSGFGRPLTLPVRAALVLSLSVVLYASAKFQVPFWPVPMTLQTLVALAIGGLLGPRMAAAALLVYLAEGAVGLPVFAGTPERGIGLAYMVGPTGGYLVGNLVAAVFVGWLADRGLRARPAWLFLAMLGGVAINFALGAAWLAGFVGIEPAFALGVAPFLLGDAVKAALATAMVTVWRRRA